MNWPWKRNSPDELAPETSYQEALETSKDAEKDAVDSDKVHRATEDVPR